MIFSGNMTSLGASTIPMAEGYDCAYGVGLALVEGARNDLAVFRAMLEADYKEMAIYNESTGYVRESELAALHEAVGGGIFKKIAELFKKLVAKVKSIFHSLMAKFNGLTMKDKELVKKYEKELARKRNLDKLEVKFRKTKSGDGIDNILAAIEKVDFKEDSKWDDDSWERVKVFLDGKNVDSVDEYVTELIDDCFEDEDTLELKEIGGWRALAVVLKDNKLQTKTENTIKKTTRELEKLVNKYDKAANDAAKASSAEPKDDTKAKASEDANKVYDMAVAYQTAMLAKMQAVQQGMTLHYKQCKAAFIKAVAVNEKKLEESAVYAQALAEAAEDEVENVITSALSDEEISDLSAASTNVKDGDVSDDPYKLTYGPDRYTDNASYSKADGSVDTTIGDGKVEESAFFGELFW